MEIFKERGRYSMKQGGCISEKVTEGQWVGLRASVERLASIVTGGNITEMGAN